MEKLEVYWNAIGTIGLEHLALQKTTDGIIADGLILRHHNGIGIRLQYRLHCDIAWKPRELSVRSLSQDKSAAELHVFADGNGNWFDAKDQSLESLEGCIDVDVMATPFTNTLALKHLQLAPDESREIEVVYVAIPELRWQRVTQRYTCLMQSAAGSRYLYENVNSNFKAELWVDAEQLVIVYQGVWERLNLHGGSYFVAFSVETGP